MLPIILGYFLSTTMMEISTYHVGTSMIQGEGVMFQNFRKCFIGPIKGEW